jgi:hypothetical protein
VSHKFELGNLQIKVDGYAGVVFHPHAAQGAPKFDLDGGMNIEISGLWNQVLWYSRQQIGVDINGHPQYEIILQFRR